jgi:hypothetical protein
MSSSNKPKRKRQSKGDGKSKKRSRYIKDSSRSCGVQGCLNPPLNSNVADTSESILYKYCSDHKCSKCGELRAVKSDSSSSKTQYFANCKKHFELARDARDQKKHAKDVALSPLQQVLSRSAGRMNQLDAELISIICGGGDSMTWPSACAGLIFFLSSTYTCYPLSLSTVAFFV